MHMHYTYTRMHAHASMQYTYLTSAPPSMLVYST